MKRLEDHNLRLIANEFFNGLPTQPFDKRSAWGIKAAIRYDSSSTILKLLQPVNFRRTSTTPNRAAVSKVGLNNGGVWRGVTPPNLKYSGFRRAIEDLAGQREKIL